MQHIQELHIGLFRGIRNMTLPHAGDVTVLVGATNAGKTSVLEAIAIFCRPLDPWQWITVAGTRDARFSNIPRLESLKWMFPQQQTINPNDLLQGTIQLAGRGSFPITNVTASFSEFITDVSLMAEDEEEYFSGELRRGIDIALQATINAVDSSQPQRFEETLQLWEHERFIQQHRSQCPVLPTSSVSPYAQQIEQLRIDKLQDDLFAGLKASLLPLLQQLDNQITEIKVLSQAGFRRTFYLAHTHLGIAPLNCFGDGLRRLLLIGTLIQLSQGGVMVLDELESAFDAETRDHILLWLIRTCAQYRVQLFVTTSSSAIVRSLYAAGQIAGRDIVGYRISPHHEQTSLLPIEP